MSFEYLFLSLLLGVLFGILTGLLPGIHINLVAIFVLTISFILPPAIEAFYLVIFLISMGVIHSFIDFIPSLLFGVPDSDTVLSVLPGHKLVLEGRAYEAIYLSSLGSFVGTLFSLVFLPLFIFYLDQIYNSIQDFIPYFLFIVLLLLILFENSMKARFFALIVSLFAGGLGLLVLNSKHIEMPLLILFTGIFGLANLLYSFNDQTKIPQQTLKTGPKFPKGFFKAISIGGISSSICSVSPGIGNAQAGTLSALLFGNKMGSELFIVVLSSINTINFILSFVTYYVIERARNGSVIVISQLQRNFSFEELLFYLTTFILISFLGFILTLKIGKLFIHLLRILNVTYINLGIILFLFILVFFLTDLIGILTLLAATFLGLICLSLQVRRVHLMSVLLIPVIFFLL